MKVLRQHYLTKILTILTGVVFLNMGFFMAEISLLKIDNQEMIENIARLISNGGFEEERDGETSSHDNAKEVDIFLSQMLIHHTSLFLIGAKSHQTQEDLYPHANHAFRFSPPPDHLNFF
jgi:hypothetical protein